VTGAPSKVPAIRSLRNTVGDDALITDADRLTVLAHDIAGPAEVEPVCAVVPATVAALQRAVAVASDHGLSVVPRGGGMSYSGGYTPSKHGGVLIDTGRLAAIEEVNLDDRCVIVEPGCT